jgi:putative transposase
MGLGVPQSTSNEILTMPRTARIVEPGVPHHITHRSVNKQKVFLDRLDYTYYLKLIPNLLDRFHCYITAYCLMSNHIHFILTPKYENGLAKFMSELQRTYSLYFTNRTNRTSSLWQGRFYSCPMHEKHLLHAIRYVEQNPMRAGLVTSCDEWEWSSVHAHLGTRDDIIVDLEPVIDIVEDWPIILAENLPEEDDHIRKITQRGK